MSRPLYLAPMSAGATIVVGRHVLSRQAVQTANAARVARATARVVAKDRARVHPRPRPHLHGSVIDRYLKWLRSGNDQRSEPGAPFGSEAE